MIFLVGWANVRCSEVNQWKCLCWGAFFAYGRPFCWLTVTYSNEQAAFTDNGHSNTDTNLLSKPPFNTINWLFRRAWSYGWLLICTYFQSNLICQPWSKFFFLLFNNVKMVHDYCTTIFVYIFYKSAPEDKSAGTFT